jgi:predicted dehydrogenase
MRVGIIGYGYWGAIVARSFSRVPEVELTCIADLAPARREEARCRFPHASLAATPSDLLDRNDVDAVVVATPANTHHDIVQSALDADKHVWVEKPIADTAAEAIALVRLAQRRSRTLFVDHTFIYSDSVRAIKQVVAGHQFGEMHLYASVRTNSGVGRTDASIFHDLAIHDLAILDFLAGQSPVAVAAGKPSARQAAAGQDQCVTLAYASGLRADIRVNWCAPAKARRVVISSARQTVEFDDLELHHKVRLREHSVDARGGRASAGRGEARRLGRIVPLNGPRESLANAVDCFLHSIRSGERPLSDGWQGVRLAAILDACKSSAETDGNWTDVRASPEPLATAPLPRRQQPDLRGGQEVDVAPRCFAAMKPAVEAEDAVIPSG